MDELYNSFELTIAGRQVFLPRSLEMARRVENAVGAIDPFARRLEKGIVTTSELARFYGALVRGLSDPPAAKAIDAWIFERGVYGHAPAAMFAMSLIMSSELFQREAARLQASVTEAEKRNARGPFAPTGA